MSNSSTYFAEAVCSAAVPKIPRDEGLTTRDFASDILCLDLCGKDSNSIPLCAARIFVVLLLAELEVVDFSEAGVLRQQVKEIA